MPFSAKEILNKLIFLEVIGSRLENRFAHSIDLVNP
jgi:hypothetical protein